MIAKFSIVLCLSVASSLINFGEPTETDCIIRGKKTKCFKCLTCNRVLQLDCVCDGKFDCPDFSDEFFCAEKRRIYRNRLHYLDIVLRFGLYGEETESSVDLAHRTCLPYESMTSSHRQACEHCSFGKIQCDVATDAPTCIFKEQLCDGSSDCPGGEDERYCSRRLLRSHRSKDKSTVTSKQADLSMGLSVETLSEMTVRCSDFVKQRRDKSVRTTAHVNMASASGLISSNQSRDIVNRTTFPSRTGGSPPINQSQSSAWTSQFEGSGSSSLDAAGSSSVQALSRAASGVQLHQNTTVDRGLHSSDSNEQADVELVDVQKVCDGIIDCANAGDEMFCPNQYYCLGKQPLHIDDGRILDGVKDCEDGSDECAILHKSTNYNLINNLALQVLVWIMAITALVGNLVVIGNTVTELIKISGFARASFFLRNRKQSTIPEADPTTKNFCFSPSFKANLKGSSRFRKGRGGIGGHRRLVRIWNSVLVLNLATADLLIGVYLMCLAVMSFLNQEQTRDPLQSQVYDRQWRASSMCSSLGALLLTSSQASVYTLVALTTLRLHTVLRPFASYHLKFRYLSATVLGIWFVAVMFSTAPMMPPFRDSFLSSAWLPFPQIKPPVVNRNVADSIVRKVAFLADSPILESTSTLNDTMSWSVMYSYLKRVAPAHGEWRYYGFYSENNVCMPKMYVTTADDFWAHTIAMVVVNFLSVVYIACAYVTIYCKSSGVSRFRYSETKASENAGSETSVIWKQSGLPRALPAITRSEKPSRKRSTKNCRWQAQRRVSSRRSVPTGGRQRTRNSTAEIQRRIAMLVITDCMCWFPICIMSFVSVAGTPIPYTAYAVTAIGLLPINSALNPLLYSRIFQSLWSRGLSSIRSSLSSDSGGSGSSANGNEKTQSGKKNSSLSSNVLDESSDATSQVSISYSTQSGRSPVASDVFNKDASDGGFPVQRNLPLESIVENQELDEIDESKE